MFANYWTNRKMQTLKESSMKKFREHEFEHLFHYFVAVKRNVTLKQIEFHSGDSLWFSESIFALFNSL